MIIKFFIYSNETPINIRAKIHLDSFKVIYSYYSSKSSIIVTIKV